MGASLGVRAELQEVEEAGEESASLAVLLAGPAKAQRLARAELQNLARFYFPELWSHAWPACCWVKGAPAARKDGASQGQVEQPTADESHEDLASWESALRKQWGEDDDIFDEELPVEPLEAPDEGPEIFEGETMMPELDMSRPFQMLLLVGLPGSGKSTLAKRLHGWDVVNQDTLGDRKACVEAARELLAKNRRLVVDRCNCTRLQRRVWLELADDYEAGVACIWLDVPEEVCGERVLQRFGHQTLPAEDKSLAVIAAFARRFEPPMEAEGFVRWRVRDDDDLDEALAGHAELVKEAEAGLPEDDDVPAKRRRLEAPQALELHSRAARGHFLRVLRRQVEFYFSDKNLKRDWFFQEKIASEPEPGWLELCYIMSCPRVRDVHRASEQDVLDALASSSLKVKEVDGRHWLARPQPLPRLEIARPGRPNSELLHDSVDREEETTVKRGDWASVM
ncbi:unnamed protein product [Effrenium voratum]|nr:unnamed protein product [Effrenium voratum]